MYHITRGLDLPINGKPDINTIDKKSTTSVALVGYDYVNMKPTLLASVGDTVKIGQPLFANKKQPGILYTATASGRITAINRGHQRALESIVIERDGKDSALSFTIPDISSANSEKIRDVLVSCGMWTSLRTRPFSTAPAIDSQPAALFVTAMDSNPLAAPADALISRRLDDFHNGLRVLCALVSSRVYVCIAENDKNEKLDIANVSYHVFAGKHPAGNVGTHMHFLSPAGRNSINWHIGYQDVIAIGSLFASGTLDVSRIISLAGPQVIAPRLIETTLGAHISELCTTELKEDANRIISGSVFNGRKALASFDWLGRFHLQVSVIREDKDRRFVHYLSFGAGRFSVMNIYLSKLLPGKMFDFTSTTNGSERAMVPIGSYEKVMPLDILPTQLLRSLIVKDIETAEQLGCLELDEEDLSLCTFACPGKYEYGPILRENLTLIAKEG